MLKDKVRANTQAMVNMDAINVLNAMYQGENSYPQQSKFTKLYSVKTFVPGFDSQIP